jgi:hypothetical protein
MGHFKMKSGAVINQTINFTLKPERKFAKISEMAIFDFELAFAGVDKLMDER